MRQRTVGRRAPTRLTFAVVAALLFLALTACGLPSSGTISKPVPTTLIAPSSNPEAGSAQAPRGTASNVPAPAGARGLKGPMGPGRRPNIVFISTDDQADYDLRWMPYTRRLLSNQGVTFRDFVAPEPLCCPSRAMMLTGQYAQNNGVRLNEGPYGGYKRLNPEHTIATWLHSAGYHTAFVGKYLNGYEKHAHGREPGWDIWNPIIHGVYRYFDYTMYNNGHHRTYPDLYSADLIGDETNAYIRRFARSSKPFFIWSSQVAPHGACVPSQELRCWTPPVAARRDALRFGDARPPSMSDPAYNEGDVSDKPGWVRGRAPVSSEHIRQYFVARIRSLQAVDEAVRSTVATLRRTGVLANTMIAFTSDNGYLLGEHRLAAKDDGYEQALQVPLVVRGPGIPHGVVRDTEAGMQDLAPTFLDAAHARADITVDGLSLLPALRRNAPILRDTMLLQSGPVHDADLPFGWFYRGVRTARYTYLYYPSSGEAELYDRKLDPHELTNLSDDPRYHAVEAELASRVDALGSCHGADCRTRFGAVPGPTQ